MFLQPSAWIKPAAQRLWPTTISRPQAPFLPLQNTVRCSFCTLSIVRYCMLFRPVDQILLVNLSKTCFFSLPRGFLKSPLLHALEFYLLCTSYNPQALLRREAPTHSHLTEHIAYIYMFPRNLHADNILTFYICLFCPYMSKLWPVFANIYSYCNTPSVWSIFVFVIEYFWLSFRKSISSLTMGVFIH